MRLAGILFPVIERRSVMKRIYEKPIAVTVHPDASDILTGSPGGEQYGQELNLNMPGLDCIE